MPPNSVPPDSANPNPGTLTVGSVRNDLMDEHAALDAVLASLSEDQWRAPTPADRWSVADGVAHLTYFDRTATEAITDPAEFQRSFEALLASAEGGEEGMDDFTIGWSRNLPGSEVLEAWRTASSDLIRAAGTLAEDARLPWYGPSMGAKSFLTARLMETWAHGQDVVDGVSGHREPTDRLKHIAQLGYITRKWTYLNRGEEVPEGEVRVQLSSPGGEVWTWGEDSAGDSITGPAEDFCLVVCQRRNVADTDLVVTGELATDWMNKAQAFAGPPTDGRRRST